MHRIIPTHNQGWKTDTRFTWNHLTIDRDESGQSYTAGLYRGIKAHVGMSDTDLTVRFTVLDTHARNDKETDILTACRGTLSHNTHDPTPPI